MRRRGAARMYLRQPPLSLELLQNASAHLRTLD
jgi:hypothetical protein